MGEIFTTVCTGCGTAVFRSRGFFFYYYYYCATRETSINHLRENINWINRLGINRAKTRGPFRAFFFLFLISSLFIIKLRRVRVFYCFGFFFFHKRPSAVNFRWRQIARLMFDSSRNQREIKFKFIPAGSWKTKIQTRTDGSAIIIIRGRYGLQLNVNDTT